MQNCHCTAQLFDGDSAHLHPGCVFIDFNQFIFYSELYVNGKI